MENARPAEQNPIPEPSPAPPPPPQPQAPAAGPKSPMRKHAGIAFVLSAFPGMGHIYCGLYLRGVLFFTVIASLMAMIDTQGEEEPILGFIIAFVWIFNVIDAVRQAKLINFGYAQDLGLEDMPKLPRAGQGGLLAGIILFGIGIVACLEMYLDIDMTWLFDMWPVALMAMGAWLIIAYFRDRMKLEDSGDSIMD